MSGSEPGAVSDLDLDELAARATTAARRDRTGATVRSLRPLEGGVSSLTFASVLSGSGDEKEVVLKVAPPGLAPVRNRDVLRQAAVLRRLTGHEGFPVPAVLFEDVGRPPEVPPLFGMELRPGQAYEPRLDVSEDPPDPEVAAERMRVAARALARMHSPTPDALGLADEPVSGPVDELDRWRRLFATVDDDIAPGHEALATRLADRVPAAIPARLMHGDYRLANMLFRGTLLEAVIDWEIWSVGDPRVDLAWLLMHTDPAHVFHLDRSPADRAAGSALPSAPELLAEYTAVRSAAGAAPEEGAEVARDLSWFLAVGFYKVASTIAVIHKRDRKRATPDPKVQVGAQHLDQVLAAGHRCLDDPGR